MGLRGLHRGRRGNLELIHQLLDCIQELGGGKPVPKTNVMHCSGLNTASFSRYLTLLENNGIVVLEEGGVRVTAQGAYLRLLTARVLRALNLHDSEPLVVRLGLQLYRRLGGVYRDPAPAIPDCDYVIAVLPNAVLCLGVEGGYIVLRCCSICSCTTLYSAPREDLLEGRGERLVDEFMGAAMQCLKGPSPPPPAEARRTRR